MTIRESNTIGSNDLQRQAIDWLRFVLACLVVMIHVDGGMIYDGYSGVWRGGIFDTFHILFAQGICRIAVPCFFVISGYLYFSKLSTWDVSIYIQKEKTRVKSLLVPYILWNLLAIVIYVAVKCIKTKIGMGTFSIADFWNGNGGIRMFWDCQRAVDESSVKVLGMTIHNGFPFNGPLWFIRDLFIMTLLSPIIHWLVTHFRKGGIIAITLLMILGIWLPFEGFSSLAFAFFSIGAYLRIKKLNIVEFCRAFKGISYCLTIIFLICSTLLCGVHPVLCGISQRLLALFGCPAFFNLAADLIESGKTKVNEKLSKSSFFVFAAQRIYVIPLSVFLTKAVIPFEGQIVGILQYLVSSALVVCICVVAYFGMKKLMPKALNVLTGSR